MPPSDGRATRTNILLEMSLVLILAAIALVSLSLWVGMLLKMAPDAARWYVVPVFAVAVVPKVVVSAVRLCAQPMGGLVIAVILGVGVYNVLLVWGIGFMPQIAVGLLEIVILAWIRRRRGNAGPVRAAAVPAA